MSKDIVFDEEAVSRLLRGANRMVDTVRATFGPRGGNVALQSGSGPPRISSLGSEVALEVELTDPIENMAVRLLREAASRTMAEVGDGTISTLLLAQSILVQATRILAAGASSHLLVQEMQDATGRIIEELSSLSEPLTAESARSVAINAAQDLEIGTFVAEAMGDSLSTVAHIEAARGILPLSRSVSEGMRLPCGFSDRRFSPADANGEIVLTDACVLLTASSLRRVAPLLPIMEQASKANKALLIVAPEIAAEALETCIVNFQRGTLRVVCVRAPATQETQDALEDVGWFTGTNRILDQAGANLSELMLEHLGHARKVIITSASTTFLDGRGHVDQPVIDRISAQLEVTSSAADRALLEARLARLQCRATVIQVGGATDLEFASRRAKAERALCALRAGAADGVVPGGGVALLRAGDAMRLFAEEGLLDPGSSVMRMACEVLVRQLALNSGYDPGAVLSRIRESPNLSLGFDVNRQRFDDLISVGIVDPLRVLVTALRSAASLATTVVTARAAIFQTKIRVTTELEKKYANKGGYSVARSLAWPPYSQDYDVRGFANFLPDHTEQGERVWQIEAGIERVIEDTATTPKPHPEEDLEFTISVSCMRASIRPESPQVVILGRDEDVVSNRFQFSFADAGTWTVLVEFYFRRVWMGQITMDVEADHPSVGAAAVEQDQ